MSVRAKFTVVAIKRQKYGRDQEVHTVEMSPVYGNGDANHENTKFWQATPQGRVELGCVNQAAAEQFELGKEYYLDFTKAE